MPRWAPGTLPSNAWTRIFLLMFQGGVHQPGESGRRPTAPASQSVACGKHGGSLCGTSRRPSGRRQDGRPPGLHQQPRSGSPAPAAPQAAAAAPEGLGQRAGGRQPREAGHRQGGQVALDHPRGGCRHLPGHGAGPRVRGDVRANVLPRQDVWLRPPLLRPGSGVHRCAAAAAIAAFWCRICLLRLFGSMC